MSALDVARVSKAFGRTRALKDVTFAVEAGEFFCVVGPTNAGKSTLLKTIAGLHRPDEGRIALDGTDVTDRPPHERDVSLLFQNIALFPSLTGFENIAFPLRKAGLSRAAVEERVHAVAELLKIGHVLDRLPRTFSGGEQQRTAIGRAIVRPSRLLLLDEPLSNLDARIRIALRIEFKKLHRERKQTIVYVTHDQVEAMSLSDRVAVLSDGAFQQIGSPEDVYERPTNRFVAEFIGSPPMNILDAELSDRSSALHLAGDGFDIVVPRDLQRVLGGRPHRHIGFGIRPEDVRVALTRSPETPIAARVSWVERLGGKSMLAMGLGGASLKAVVPDGHPVRAEGPAWIGLEPKAHHLLDPESGMFIGAEAKRDARF